MAPKFGTSGLRGLVTELTADFVADYTRAYLAACDHGGAVHVGWDLRPSSPGIAEAVIATIRAAGVRAIRQGALPTPALALASMGQGHGAVMITGSHIPADRNGLKFYTPSGEITKTDETAITAALGQPAPTGETGALEEGSEAKTDYVTRYTKAFGADLLAGLSIGIYQHSSVARDVMVAVIEGLGARAVPLARSDTFIPVDTEAVDPDTRAMLAGWCAEHGLDALISTDGDGDRPMVCEASGQIVPGDVLGVLSALQLGAKVICTPVSSNSMVSEMAEFSAVHLTRIGSPYVIDAMEQALADDAAALVAGFEANGGFLLGFTATGPAGGALVPLMTRDCMLPIVAPLALARARAQSLSDLVATLPPRFTAADRLQDIPTEKSLALIAELERDPAARAAFFADMGPEQALDLTDGLRVTFESGAVVHLRPSGNAPECRCYAEADSPDKARALMQKGLEKLQARLGG